MRALIVVASLLVLTGCDWFNKKPVDIRGTDPKQTVPLNLPKPAPLDLSPYKVKFYVVDGKDGQSYLAIPAAEYDKLSILLFVLGQRIDLLQQQNEEYRNYYEKQ